MSQNVLGHHYAIWTSDSNILLASNFFFGPAKGWPSFQTLPGKDLGRGLFKVILVGTGVQLKLRKHPNAYIAIK
jgi:hypothetical protein